MRVACVKLARPLRNLHVASDTFHNELLRIRRSQHTPTPTYRAELRREALALAAHASPTEWETDPITSLFDGTPLTGGEVVPTTDAFGRTNGAQVLATNEQLELLARHAKAYVAPRRDLRAMVRRAEACFFEVGGARAAWLIANQLRDFGKQDGLTEVEEAIEANDVERRLNDALFEAEGRGELDISRAVALVSCVSNFSHFLDLSRKTLRSLELGVPVMVLSRSNTSQHCFRWARELHGLLQREGVPPEMLSYCSASLPQQRSLLARAAAAADAVAPAAFPGAASCRAQTRPPMLFTGSRALASTIKAQVPGTIASTGGPNLMLNLLRHDALARAAALSATIEHAGQCTALRVLVEPPAAATASATGEAANAAPDTFCEAVGAVGALAEASDALATGGFAELLSPALASAGSSPPPGYAAAAAGSPVYVRKLAELPAEPPAQFDEFWRRPVVDIVAPPLGIDGTGRASGSRFLHALGRWLVEHQPISLAVNGEGWESPQAGAPPPPQYDVLRTLFEVSSLCVYTVGDAGAPALTVQARPQDGEIFGELPPALEPERYTTSPVFVPSAGPGYFSHYRAEHLRARAAAAAAAAQKLDPEPSSAAHALREMVRSTSSPEVSGYVCLLADYLRTAAVGARRAPVSARTCLYGLQTPPADGRQSVLRCEAGTPLDALLPFLAPFVLTNAAEHGAISVDPLDSNLCRQLDKLRSRAPRVGLLEVLHESPASFEASIEAAKQRAATRRFHSITRVRTHHPDAYPLVGQFVTRLLPYGHVKSTRPDDAHFLSTMEPSQKWLRCEL